VGIWRSVAGPEVVPGRSGARRRSSVGVTGTVAVAAVVSSVACWRRADEVQSREGSADELAGRPLPPDPSSLSNDRMFAALLVASSVLTLALMVLLVASWLRAATGVGPHGRPGEGGGAPRRRGRFDVGEGR
jgi:hypothetical protein